MEHFDQVIINSSMIRKLTAIFLLVFLGQCDYFSRLQIDPAQQYKASNAIQSLLNTLDLNLECNVGAQPWTTQHIGNQVFNDFGSFSFDFKQQFKNNDLGSYTYTQPSMNSFRTRNYQTNENIDLYYKLKHVATHLSQIKEKIVRYNNMIVGSNNRVNGNKNIVIGCNNAVRGNNFWVFDSNVDTNGIHDGVLIVQNYLIEMANMEEIRYNPRKAVRCLKNGQGLTQFRRWEKAAAQHLKVFI